jgi:hypothetical protein
MPASAEDRKSNAGYGHVAEWLRSGLQNRLPRFNSGRGLHQLHQQTSIVCGFPQTCASPNPANLANPGESAAVTKADTGVGLLKRCSGAVRLLMQAVRSLRSAQRRGCDTRRRPDTDFWWLGQQDLNLRQVPEISQGDSDGKPRPPVGARPKLGCDSDIDADLAGYIADHYGACALPARGHAAPSAAARRRDKRQQP